MGVMDMLAKRFPSVRSGLSMKHGAQALVNGDGAEAVRLFQQAVEAKTEILKSSRNATVAQAMIQLASAHKLAGDELTATQTLTEALDILQEKSPSDPDMHIHMNNLGVLLRNTGQFAEASGIFTEALRLTATTDNDVNKNDFDTMKITAAKNSLLYSKQLNEKGLDSSSELLKAEQVLQEIISDRAVPEERANFHAEHYGLMKEVKDAILGQALASMSDVLFARFSYSEEDNVEVIDEAISTLKEAIQIFTTNLNEDGTGEYLQEIEKLNQREVEMIEARDKLITKEKATKLRDSPPNDFEK